MIDVFLALLRYTSRDEKSYQRQVNMREQNSNEHQLPVLDEQTVKVLMRQMLGRQDIEYWRPFCC